MVLALLLTGSRAQGAQETVPHALGEQKIAVLVAEIPGLAISTSIPDIRDIFFSKTNPSIDSYLREVSYNKTWATGDVFGPYPLSRTYGWENNEWNAALGEALKAAGSAVDLRNYNQLFLIYPVPGFANTWSGNAGHGCVIEGYCPAGGSVTVTFVGASAGPATRAGIYGVVLHEFLHDMGEPHADILDYAPETLGIPDTRYAGAPTLDDDPTVGLLGRGLNSPLATHPPLLGRIPGVFQESSSVLIFQIVRISGTRHLRRTSRQSQQTLRRRMSQLSRRSSGRAVSWRRIAAILP